METLYKTEKLKDSSQTNGSLKKNYKIWQAKNLTDKKKVLPSS